MSKIELIEKLKRTTTVVDFYKLKGEIIEALGEKSKKKGVD